MSGTNWQPPDRVPTLTEVVDLPDAPAAPMLHGHGGEALPLEADVIAADPSPAGTPAAHSVPVIHEEAIVQRVLDDLQRQVDLMLEYRLREVLTPILTRAADSVMRDARAELASTLRDVVARAVAQELARHRGR